MTHYQRFRVSAVQVRKQPLQRLLLGRCPGVRGSLAVGSQAADVAYPDGMPVMVLAMRPDHLFGSSRLDGAVSRNHVVVAAAYLSERTVVAVNVRHDSCDDTNRNNDCS